MFFPDFVAQQSSNNSETLSFLALAIALLQCNSRLRLGLLLIVLGVSLVFIGNPVLPASVGTHSESLLAAVTIAVWWFLPPPKQRPALFILALVVLVVSCCLTDSGTVKPFWFIHDQER